MRVNNDQVLNSAGSSVVILALTSGVPHRRDTLCQRQMRDRTIGPGAGERVLAARQTEQCTDRAGRGDTTDGEAVGRRLGR